jgi:hypothetical protein
MTEKSKLDEWFNSTPHDMGKEEYDSLLAAVESEVQRRIAEMGEKPVAWTVPTGGVPNHDGWIEARINKWSEFTMPLYAAPPQAQLQAAIDAAREKAIEYFRSAWFTAESVKDMCDKARSALIGKPLGDSQ